MRGGAHGELSLINHLSSLMSRLLLRTARMHVRMGKSWIIWLIAHGSMVMDHMAHGSWLMCIAHEYHDESSILHLAQNMAQKYGRRGNAATSR